MITNERELRAALDWLDYWKHNRSGEQSWIGNEQARQRMAEFRKQIDEYKQRTGQVNAKHAPAAPQRGPEAATRTINRAELPDSTS